VEVEMKIRGLMMDPITNMPIVILKEASGGGILPIWVGVYEANAIALEIEKVVTPRPMRLSSPISRMTRSTPSFGWNATGRWSPSIRGPAMLSHSPSVLTVRSLSKTKSSNPRSARMAVRTASKTTNSENSWKIFPTKTSAVTRCRKNPGQTGDYPIFVSSKNRVITGLTWIFSYLRWMTARALVIFETLAPRG
jgi:hypothetical protein